MYVNILKVELLTIIAVKAYSNSYINSNVLKGEGGW